MGTGGWNVQVAVFVTSDDAVVLARRAGHEAWEVPVVTLTPGEAPEDAVRRVAREQLGVDVHWVELAWADARGGEQGPTLVLHYTAEASGYPRPAAGWEEARFFQVEHLPPLADELREVLYRTLTDG